MRKKQWIVMMVCAACLTHAAPLNEREAGIIKSRLAPAPQRVELGDGADVTLDALPRDVVICDWFYGAPVKGEKEGQTFPTLRHFKSKGFPVL
ncbi:MAG: hypothetical protein PHE10_09895, partial [Kiritimatiellae bacterium]|nr:hypothetical protein [Kiritimatiellia bacterium]